jgi:hypothetical protein
MVLMPFATQFDCVYSTVRRAAKALSPEFSLDCSWLKDVHAAGRITDDIIANVRAAALCITDLTDLNPNVMWEAGYAMALEKPTVLIAQSLDSLPFDLRVHRTIQYDPSDLSSLARDLSEALRQTILCHNLIIPGESHRTVVLERNPNEAALRQHWGFRTIPNADSLRIRTPISGQGEQRFRAFRTVIPGIPNTDSGDPER